MGTSSRRHLCLISQNTEEFFSKISLGCIFKIDEIIQAWNEIYDAERWIQGLSSFRLQPLLRRRAPQLYQSL